MPTLDSNEEQTIDIILWDHRHTSKESLKKSITYMLKEQKEAAVSEARKDENDKWLDIRYGTGDDITDAQIIERIASLNQPTKERE